MKLRLHYVAALFEDLKCNEVLNHMHDLEFQSNQLSNQFNKKVQERKLLIEKRNDELKKTSSEELAVLRINTALKSLGIDSFELRLITGNANHSGQYGIFSHEARRSVNTLSTGEMNLVAFLYFMQDLNRDRTEGKPLFVILDNPMNSNDSSSQYLMYSSIIRFYGDRNKSRKMMGPNDILIVMTHNAHFYLNCRPYNWKPGNPRRISCYILNKIGDCTHIKTIDDEKWDIKTGYHALWGEFILAYEQGNPGSMWNPLRRIIESFSNFSGVDSLETMIAGSEPEDINSVVIDEIKKGLDVNSHGIDDIAFDPNALSRYDLLKVAKWYFDSVGYSSHFKKFCDL